MTRLRKHIETIITDVENFKAEKRAILLSLSVQYEATLQIKIVVIPQQMRVMQGNRMHCIGFIHLHLS